MSSTKILWGQITLVCLIVLVTMWAATQWVAWKLGYQAQLGPPWFELGQGRPVCVPPAFFWWWYAFDAYAPEVFVEGACISASGGIISIMVAFGMSVWRAREAKTAATYGSARWCSSRIAIMRPSDPKMAWWIIKGLARLPSDAT
jgi:type IV secretion system protein VirD4